jgi:hypothetical protein
LVTAVKTIQLKYFQEIETYTMQLPITLRVFALSTAMRLTGGLIAASSCSKPRL